MLRESDILARIGGDEFTLLIFDFQHEEDLKKVVKKISEACRLTVVRHGKAFSVEASIGYSIFPDDGVSAEALLHKADQVMYECKYQQKQRDLLG